MPFTVSNGSIIHPAGRPWSGYGINLNHDQVSEAVIDATLKPLIDLFPLFGFIRLAFHSYADPMSQELQQFFHRMAGIPVLCEDHTSISGGPYTGTQLAAQNAFFQAIARGYAGNDFVWIGTLNEPSDKNIPAISVQQQSNYNAIRATGSKTIIAMELPGGGNPGTIGKGFGMNPAVYATMSGIVWGPALLRLGVGLFDGSGEGRCRAQGRRQPWHRHRGSAVHPQR